jgi:SAM-dependent methyltransferase
LPTDEAPLKPLEPSRARELGRLRARWEAFGREDPLWAVLSNPAKKGRKWDVDEFFGTGEAEIAAAMARLGALGITPALGSALDFGCGVGRLTRALAGRFERAVGVDVSLAMIQEARRLNPRLIFIHNDRPDLHVVETASIDFAYSRLVLQHVPPVLSLGYVREFGRVLAPGGVAMFQIPTSGPRRGLVRRAARSLLEWVRLRPRDFGGYAVPREEVESEIGVSGMRLVRGEADSTAAGWEGLLYITVKPSGE